MARSLGDICSEAAVLLDDEAGARYTPAMLRTWANEAQREVSKMSECLRAKTTLNTDADVQSYALTSNVIRLTEVYWQADNDSNLYPLEYRDHRASRPIWGVSRSRSEGTPQLYWTEGFPGNFTLAFYPTPSQDGTAEIHYSRFSVDLATNGSDDATALDLPIGWEGTCIPWIVMRAMQTSRESSRADEFRQEFMVGVDALITASVRYVDEPGSMTMDSWYDIFDDGDY